MMPRAIALFFVTLLAAQADTLVLKDGTKVQGRWWSADVDQIHFLVDNQLQHYARSQVSSVTFGEGAAAPPLDAAPAPAAPAAPKAAAAPAETRTVTLPPAPVRNFREPEEAGPVYFRNDSGDLVALERNRAAEQSRGSTQYWEMPNARSPVRLKTAPEMTFVVRVAPGVDPASYSLYPMASENGARRTEAGRGRKTGPVTRPFTIARLHDATYTLTVKDLAAGEYSFSPSGSNDAYCFGVDP